MNSVSAVSRPVQAMIMAGGRGERLFPLTVNRPKPTVPFGGVFRIVDFTLLNCLNSGLNFVSLLTQYKHEDLQAYIQESWSRLWGERTRQPLNCLPPLRNKHYRGTADAVFQNIDTLRRRGPGSVLILSADHIYHMDYRKLLRYHADTSADLTIATVEQPLATAKHFGVVEVDRRNRIVRFDEKPSNPQSRQAHPDRALISMGVYVFRIDALMDALSDYCESGNGFDFGHHIIPSLIGEAHVQAYEFREEGKDLPGYWRDIGTPDGYYDASMDLVGPDAAFDPYAHRIWPSYSVPQQSSVQPHSRLRNNCRVDRSILSPDVSIEDGAVIESSVLMSGVSVGKGARIRHAIIEEGVHIPAGHRIGFDTDSDSKHHFATDAGVVIVSETPKRALSNALFVTRLMAPRPRLVHLA